jgi:hypothetical protein
LPAVWQESAKITKNKRATGFALTLKNYLYGNEKLVLDNFCSDGC